MCRAPFATSPTYFRILILLHPQPNFCYIPNLFPYPHSRSISTSFASLNLTPNFYLISNYFTQIFFLSSMSHSESTIFFHFSPSPFSARCDCLRIIISPNKIIIIIDLGLLFKFLERSKFVFFSHKNKT